jgi:hypothetical protein
LSGEADADALGGIFGAPGVDEVLVAGPGVEGGAAHARKRAGNTTSPRRARVFTPL